MRRHSVPGDDYWEGSTVEAMLNGDLENDLKLPGKNEKYKPF